MFWQTARDDPMFNTIRVISGHQDTQIYGGILPDELTNQEMLDSKAYKEYYVVASGAEPPKAKTKYKKKADEPVTPSKSKSTPEAKGTRLKTPAKVTQSGKKRQPASVPKAKGLKVLSEVALSEDEQMKIVTKRSKTQFHKSHASGSGDGVDTQSKVPDEQQQKFTGTDKGAGDKPESDMNDDSEETESDDNGDDLTHPSLVYTPPNYRLTDEEANQEGDDTVKEGEEEKEEDDDMYRDLNLNLERSDDEMTKAQATKETEDAYVTLTVVPLVVQQQSSSMSSDLVSKYINPSPNAGIDFVLNQNIQSDTYNKHQLTQKQI
ncbi:hypothetical protein Tco_1515149 [Tanacetum coccineum]